MHILPYAFLLLFRFDLQPFTSTDDLIYVYYFVFIFWTSIVGTDGFNYVNGQIIFLIF